MEHKNLVFDGWDILVSGETIFLVVPGAGDLVSKVNFDSSLILKHDGKYYINMDAHDYCKKGTCKNCEDHNKQMKIHKKFVLNVIKTQL